MNHSDKHMYMLTTVVCKKGRQKSQLKWRTANAKETQGWRPHVYTHFKICA